MSLIPLTSWEVKDGQIRITLPRDVQHGSCVKVQSKLLENAEARPVVLYADGGTLLHVIKHNCESAIFRYEGPKQQWRLDEWAELAALVDHCNMDYDARMAKSKILPTLAKDLFAHMDDDTRWLALVDYFLLVGRTDDAIWFQELVEQELTTENAWRKVVAYSSFHDLKQAIESFAAWYDRLGTDLSHYQFRTNAMWLRREPANRVKESLIGVLRSQRLYDEGGYAVLMDLVKRCSRGLRK